MAASGEQAPYFVSPRHRWLADRADCGGEAGQPVGRFLAVHPWHSWHPWHPSTRLPARSLRAGRGAVVIVKGLQHDDDGITRASGAGD